MSHSISNNRYFLFLKNLFTSGLSSEENRIVQRRIISPFWPQYKAIYSTALIERIALSSLVPHDVLSFLFQAVCKPKILKPIIIDVFPRESKGIDYLLLDNLVQDTLKGQPTRWTQFVTQICGAVGNSYRLKLDSIEITNQKRTLWHTIDAGNLNFLAENARDIEGGYIIDFDLSMDEEWKTKEPAKGRRAGSLPFLSVDVLRNGCGRSIAYDAESLLYTLLWTTHLKAGPNFEDRLYKYSEFEDSILLSWCPPEDHRLSSPVDIASRKGIQMMYECVFDVRILRRMHPYFSVFESSLMRLREALFPPQIPKTPLQVESHIVRNEAEVLLKMKEILVFAVDSFGAETTNALSELQAGEGIRNLSISPVSDGNGEGQANANANEYRSSLDNAHQLQSKHEQMLSSDTEDIRMDEENRYTINFLRTLRV